jgi:hypothetical protein
VQLTFAQQREQAAADAKATHARSAHDTKLALAAEREVLAARDTMLLDLRAQVLFFMVFNLKKNLKSFFFFKCANWHLRNLRAEVDAR